MGAFEQVIGVLVPYAPWIALALVLLVLVATARNSLAGSTSLGFVWVAVIFFLVSAYLFLSGYLLYAFAAAFFGVIVALLDGFHERRINRRAWARMKG